MTALQSALNDRHAVRSVEVGIPANTVNPLHELRMSRNCRVHVDRLEPEDDESGRCEICRMPWGPSSSAPSVDDFTVALPPEAGQMIEDNFAALALPNPIQ